MGILHVINIVKVRHAKMYVELDFSKRGRKRRKTPIVMSTYLCWMLCIIIPFNHHKNLLIVDFFFGLICIHLCEVHGFPKVIHLIKRRTKI